MCWLQAIGLFPNEHVPHNELGNIYGRAGHYEQAADSYSQAAQLGSLLAELNLAHMLELQGFYMESRQGYQEALTKAEVSGLPQYHIRVRMKTVLPRILPATESGDIFPLYLLLSALFDYLDALLSLLLTCPSPFFPLLLLPLLFMIAQDSWILLSLAQFSPCSSISPNFRLSLTPALPTPYQNFWIFASISKRTLTPCCLCRPLRS